ncbi:MAG: PEP-CTERM sorting domain-containing protein [Aureliella sp.]
MKMRTSTFFLLTCLISCYTVSVAQADLIFEFKESTTGSATVQQGIGGTAVLGVFVKSDGTNDAFDSFDLYIDVGGDGNGLPSGITFSNSAVVAGADFPNAAKNPQSDVTSPFANADIQVSADRTPLTFSTEEIKLFDLQIEVAPTVLAGDISVAARDDSGGLMAFNLNGTNLFASNASAFTFNPGAISVSAVPEPSSFGLLAISATALFRRRSRG